MERIFAVRNPANAKRLPENALFREIVRQLGAFAAAFVLAHSGAPGAISPFALAFTCAAPQGLSLLSVAGACLGYSFAGLSGALLLRNIVSVCSAALIRHVFLRFYGQAQGAPFAGFISFSVCLSTGLAILFSQGIQFASALLLGSEAVLAGAMAWFFHGAFQSLRRGKTLFYINRRELAELIIFCGVLLMALGSYRIWNVTPAHILGVFSVLCAAFAAGESGGAVAGICAGVALYAAQGNGYLCVSFCVGGLLAGLFAPVGQLAAAAVFSLTCALIAVLEGSVGAVALLFEAAAGATLFVALPKTLFNRAQKILHAQTDNTAQPLPDASEEAARRLRKASQAMQSVCVCVEQVANGLETLRPQDMQVRPEKVREQVCAGCSAADFCWNENEESIRESFAQAALLLQAEGYIQPRDFTKSLKEACARVGELAIAFNRQQLDIAARRGARIRVQQMRDIVSDQFRSMSVMLQDLSLHCQSRDIPLPEGEKRVRQVLRKFGIPFYDALLLRDGCGHITLRVQSAGLPESLRMPKLLQALHEVCGVWLEHPQVLPREEGCLLEFTQSAQYRLHLGTVQQPAGENAVCGDYYACLRDAHGRQLLLISDGMGTGSRAAVDSAMTAELLTQLVQADLSLDCTLQIVNAALLIKSGDESLATLDIARVDLFTGKTEFYKAGAAASFVRRRHKTAALEQASLPAGILRDVQFARANASLGDGDIILLLSDGAIPEDTRQVLKTLRNWEGSDAQALAEQIAQLSEREDGTPRTDDLTVVAAVLEKL